MKSKLLFVSIFIISLGACKFFQHKGAATTAVNFPMLDSVDIYDSVKVANFKPSNAARDYAQKLYLSAIDLYANKHRAEESFPLFLQSVRIAPNPYTYLKMGEVAWVTGRRDMVFETFGMALDDRNTRPHAKMWRARIGALYTMDEGLTMLEEALKEYPFDMKAVAADTFFAGIKDNEEFKVLLAKYAVTEENRKKTVLRMFEANFSKMRLPYAIPSDSLTAANGNNIDYIYADILKDLIDGRKAFSRMVDKEYQYIAEVNVSPSYYTFIYREVNNSYSDSIGSVYYYAATVDTNGENIDRSVMACYCSPLDIQVGAIDTSGILEVKAIKQEWKYNPIDSGYSNNEVSKQQLKGKTYFRFTPQGKIERLDEGYVPGAKSQASATTEVVQ